MNEDSKILTVKPLLSSFIVFSASSSCRAIHSFNKRFGERLSHSRHCPFQVIPASAKELITKTERVHKAGKLSRR